MMFKLCDDTYMSIRIRFDCLTALAIKRWFSIIVVGDFEDLRHFK